MPSPEPQYRDRCNNYVPTGLSVPRRPSIAEFGRDHRGSVVLADADELNRRPELWWWADVSGDGSHWAWFNGHRVQVDVAFHTENRRDVNDWKGRDEIRAGGEWTVSLARQQCWEGQIASDPLAALRRIPQVVDELLRHDAIDWTSSVSAADQLLGRRVYYDRTPAYISAVTVLDQGCVMIKPVGVDRFPPAVYDTDKPEDSLDDPAERLEIKDSILSPKFWWWRERTFGDEDPAKERTFDPTRTK